MVNIWPILAMEMRRAKIVQRYFGLNHGKKAAAGVVMTVDNNKALLTKVSACFIIIEVYSMRKISVNVNLYLFP